MANRQSAPAQPNTIQTHDDLIAKISRLGEIDRGIAAIESEAETKIAEIQQNTGHACTDLLTEQKAIVKDVQSYCEVHKTALLPKGKKSADLGVGVIGWRQNTPSVKLLCADEDAVSALNNDMDRELLRTVLQVNKDAVLALRSSLVSCEAMGEGERAAALRERLDSLERRGVLRIVTGREKFFVEPVSATKTTSEVAA